MYLKVFWRGGWAFSLLNLCGHLTVWKEKCPVFRLEFVLQHILCVGFQDTVLDCDALSPRIAPATTAKKSDGNVRV